MAIVGPQGIYPTDFDFDDPSTITGGWGDWHKLYARFTPVALDGTFSINSVTLTAKRGTIHSGYFDGVGLGLSVLSRPFKSRRNTEPASADVGDRFLIPPTGSSAFLGQTNKIATYLGGTLSDPASWSFETPNDPNLEMYDGVTWTIERHGPWVARELNLDGAATPTAVGYRWWTCLNSPENSGGFPGVFWADHFNNPEGPSGAPLVPGIGQRPAGVYTSDGPNDIDYMSFFAYMPEAYTNCRVEATFGAVRPTATEFDADSFGAFCVAARVQGGTWTSGGTSIEYLDTCDGYYLFLVNNAGTAQWSLQRCNSGTFTELETSPTFDILDLNLPAAGRKVEMRITGGTTPRIRCSTSSPLVGFNATPTSGPFPANLDPAYIQGEFIDHTDSDASRIQTAGHGAFGCVTGGNLTRNVVQSFGIRDGSDVYVLMDRWERDPIVQSRGIIQNGDDLQPGDGTCIENAWVGDARSQLAGLLLDDPGNGRVQNDGNFAVGGGWCPYWALAENSVQRRQLGIEFSSAGVAAVQLAGIFLRGSWSDHFSVASSQILPADQDGKTLYMCSVTRTASGSTYQADLRWYDMGGGQSGQGTQTVIASADVTANFTDDAESVFDVQVINVGGVSQDDGVPTFVIRVDGTEITAWTSTVTGIVIDTTTGEIRDERAQAIRTGNSVGFWSLSSGGSPIYFDSWAAATVTAPPGPPPDPNPPENDQLSVAIGEEGSAASGTLSIDHDWTVTEIPQWNATSYKFDDGAEQRMTLGKRIRRRWRVEARNVDDSVVDTLRAFWVQQKGIEIPFTWTTPPPYSESVTVHFASDELATQFHGVGSGGQIGGFSFELEEILV